MLGLHNLAWWQWAALPVLIAASLLGGLLLSRLTRAILGWLASRTAATWDDLLVARSAGPLTLAWMLALVYVGLPWLELSAKVRASILRTVHALFLLAFFWALWRTVDIGAQALADLRWSREHPASRSLLPLGRRISKVALVIAGVVAALSELGYSVASLVAGLGIGGLAVALAARSTLENLFGAFSIGADQPFREGDFVKIENSMGTVESVGLRSTRIRTLDRTIITLPNGKLADMQVESFAPRDRVRLACTVGLVYGTTAAQMRQVLQGLEQALRNHPKIWPEGITVRLKELGASSLDIDVMAWFNTADFDEFQLIRQEILLQFMDVVERAGSSFAFPTRTVHVVADAK